MRWRHDEKGGQFADRAPSRARKHEGAPVQGKAAGEQQKLELTPRAEDERHARQDPPREL